MKCKTSELTGALLNRAAATATGLTADTALDFGLGCPDWLERFRPSESWAHGGPIIERERISLDFGSDSGEIFWMGHCFAKWEGVLILKERTLGGLSSNAARKSGLPVIALDQLPPDGNGVGPTPLVAAMRAFVSLKMGEEIDL